MCQELDDFLDELVGGRNNREQYVPLNQLDCIHTAIVAYDGDTPIACAGLKDYDGETAEIKRVFVRAECRGRHISVALMRQIEQAAKEQGIRRLILETGAPLVAAMALYRKMGYAVIPNYGPYQNMPDSICMQKELF